MITTPYEERVRYLRSRTDTSNRNLEKAFVPEFIDGVATPVKTHVFEDDYVLSSSANVRIFETEHILYNGMNDRTRTVINGNITIMGKRGETFNDLAKVVGISAVSLVVLNQDKYPAGTPVTPQTSVYGVVIDTGVPATLPNLISRKIVKPFVCFLDGLYMPIEHITMKSDLYNDYIMIDISWMTDKSKIRDYTKLDILQYKYLSPVSTNHILMTFDGNGSITNRPTSATDTVRYHLYSNDPHVFRCDMFVTNYEGTFGTMFNERVPGLDYRNKVKPENVFCFQDGRLVRDAVVTCKNFNVIDVRYKEFSDDSRAVVVYSKPVQFTEDNTLRLANSVVSTLGSKFEDFLDDTELSCVTFINEIYALDADKYGFVFTPVHINNAEEYPTPWDEIITYTDLNTKKVLYHLISEIFEKDTPNVRTIMQGIVDAAYHETYEDFELNDEWMLRKNLPEMFSHEEKSDPQFFEGMEGLGSSFDFFFYDYKTFEENFLAAIEYIASYDSDKLECGLKRFEITAVTNGTLIQDFVDQDTGTLKMIRGPVNRRENYVMIFVNGELYFEMNRIRYNTRYFEIPEFEVQDTDKIEIVYFLMCDNTIMPLTINDSVVTTQFLYDKDEVQLWSDITPNGVISHQDQVYQVPFYITDPWVRGHGSEPLPTGGGVEYVNGPVIYFDDSDIGYDAFVNITTEAGLNAVKDIITDTVSDSETRNILLDCADAAYNTEFPKSTVVNSYAALPESPSNGDIIYYVGSNYMTFEYGHHYKYNTTLTTDNKWEEYFSLADQSLMYSELSLRSHLSDTLSSGGSFNAVAATTAAISAYCISNPDNAMTYTTGVYNGVTTMGQDTFYIAKNGDGLAAFKQIINENVTAEDFPTQNALLIEMAKRALMAYSYTMYPEVSTLPTSGYGSGERVKLTTDTRFYELIEILNDGTGGCYVGSATIQNAIFFSTTGQNFMDMINGTATNKYVIAAKHNGSAFVPVRLLSPHDDCVADGTSWHFAEPFEFDGYTIPTSEVYSSISSTVLPVFSDYGTEYWVPMDCTEYFGESTLCSTLSNRLDAHVETDDEIADLMDAIYLYSLSEEEEPEPGGGGEPETEWYLIPDPEMYKLALSPSDLLFWDGANGWTTSKRQFRQTRYVVNTIGCHTILLPEEFKFCTNPHQYLIFHNGKCLPRSYVVIAPSKGVNKVVDIEVMPPVPDETYMGKYYHYIGDDTAGFLQNHYYLARYDSVNEIYYWTEAIYVGSNPVGHVSFYSNITLSTNDVIDIFYVPDEMRTDYNESVLKRTETTNSGYIKIDKSETMTGISRDSSFIFINGRKISYDEIKDISSDMVKVTDEYPNPASMTLSLEVYRYLHSEETYTIKGYAPDEMDVLIPEQPSVIDWLMDTHTEPSGDGTEVFPDRLTKDAVKSSILLDYALFDDDTWLAEF